MTIQTLIENQLQLNAIALRQMTNTQKLIVALTQDRRTGAGVKEDLARIFDTLVDFQHRNPEVFKTLCEESPGDVTLADALDAIASACDALEA
ncbi:hypothetical protein [Calothrix sp. NIES-2098]|uniref:hypothetical protein n=1 Tax=Calothrix sp. NIES-2098 TaxID=1954171 RepID=UPI000B610FAE|nr:hypothetical protein NIES2098_42100 [Calothrix sp. NIES-2098]